MNKTDVIRRLKELNYDPTQYWLAAGAALVLWGLREVTSDIDLGCTTQMADELQQAGCAVIKTQDGMRKFSPAPDVEIFENWRIGSVERVEGFPVLSMQGLLAMKRALNREKDQRDILRLEEALRSK